ncbi:MAG: hypothetical protein KME15_25580 [Drouetiella hepatica Uher 2000/2452]|jgi:hypothetical protein|uniref:Uncharacterized protein n=1 Tax=Drouetiella hepatica Uher 2000/2452 TaxID=904376 RepID=A0A951QIV1_9CYAN|nr:hypothetical protein [Drouetiella hepatica Uher 2000/2452]
MVGRNPISIPPVTLPEQIPETLPEAKFQLGQQVRWSCVPSQDFGRVLGIVFGSEGSVQASGYHYAIALDSSSPSFADGIFADWGYEEDLELVDPHEIMSKRSETSS